MAPDTQSGPVDPVEPDGRPEVPTPDTGREVLMPNRHEGLPPERPGSHDGEGADPPAPDPDPDPDPTRPPDVLPDPDPQDPSVAT